jgi:hypothetical protein
VLRPPCARVRPAHTDAVSVVAVVAGPSVVVAQLVKLRKGNNNCGRIGGYEFSVGPMAHESISIALGWARLHEKGVRVGGSVCGRIDDSSWIYA